MTGRSSSVRVAAFAVILAFALSAAGGTDVLELGQYPFRPKSVVPDGEGGGLLLATTNEKPFLVRLDAEGKASWAKRPALGWTPALVPVGSSAVLVSWDRGGGVWASRVEMDGTFGLQRHYTAEEKLGVTAAAGGEDRMVLALSAGQADAVVIFDEDLGAVRQFGFHRVPERVVESVAVMPDGGAVFAGTDRGTCFVGRIDSKGVAQWVKRYRYDKECGCTHVAVSDSSIVVGGWRSRQEEVVLLVLDPDGRVRHGVKSAARMAPASLVVSGEKALVVTERVGKDVPMILTRFDLERGTVVWSAGLVPDSSFYPWGVATAAGDDGEMLFVVVDPIRALFVPSVGDDLTESCSRFVPATAEWKRVDVQSEPLALGASGIDIIHGVAPPPEVEDMPTQVRRCKN